MRRLLTLLCAALAGSALWLVWPLLALFLGTGPDSVLRHADLAGGGAARIPKIVHHTWKTADLSGLGEWQRGYERAQQLHPDYEFMLWSDAAAREFVAQHYAWLLGTFDAYPYAIQRADALRYLLLDTFGGFYLDLDAVPRVRLEPLRRFSAVLRTASPSGVSNDVMAAEPHHPLFQAAVARLQAFDRAWPLPYLRVMLSTGSLFLSLALRRFLAANADPRFAVKILQAAPFSPNYHDFIVDLAGSSWHGPDARYILALYNHRYPLLALAALLVLARVCRVCTRRKSPRASLEAGTDHLE